MVPSTKRLPPLAMAAVAIVVVLVIQRLVVRFATGASKMEQVLRSDQPASMSGANVRSRS